MIYNLYSVRDEKVSFAIPFTDSSDASAERGFSMALFNNQSVIRFSPGDFSLYRVGTFDTESGYVTPCTPVFICNATKFTKNVGENNEE